MSGPRQSMPAPINPFFANSSVYRLVRDSISLAEYYFGLKQIPPLAPPKGRLITAHFSVIRQDRASTSCKFILVAYLVPPFTGNLYNLC